MKRYFYYQWNLMLLATSFFTRLPMATNIQYSPSKMKRASQYFAVVGWLLACILVGFYAILLPIIGLLPSLCVLLILSILLTGALHEDGLADTCDGFWGGHSAQQKLAIMKDSRIGTYGTCALVLVLLTKFVVWWQLAQQQQLVLALCIAYPFSRAMAISHVQDMDYVSHSKPGATSRSKSEPVAKPFNSKQLSFVFFSGVAAALTLPLSTLIYLIVACTALRYLFKALLNRHIQGYTGDSLGAAQQLQELLIYLVLLANVVTSGASQGLIK
ncbi:adenosylcobinamide-GDP ribazoletransferase [Paraglaciecola aquimarina]|uniref:Adenosylcobinamide-GDP ribazoletransferase n=1 Tax=Paraglaciecola aquimarina TaxID=1235557 RepID=A0ABU3T133_9ALTE|nr:adenosylcobinamide-GDP ribazoletransferase [Paraglaciecola aquimarina]MDU0355963.1 adenosylcobinamide-GDP ribazoletransferase [Paraglaciecola aquimarina]